MFTRDEILANYYYQRSVKDESVYMRFHFWLKPQASANIYPSLLELEYKIVERTFSLRRGHGASHNHAAPDVLKSCLPDADLAMCLAASIAAS